MYDPCSKTLFIGKKIVYLPTCHSTNDIAAELVRKENLPEGTVVITDAQTAGRGQHGTRWEASQSHNFTFSLLLRPSFLAIPEQFLLSQTVAIGVRDFVANFTGRVKIKWPNDIYINELKVGGILIENAWQGTRMSHAIVGIGLNVNQIHFASEPESETAENSIRATSLRLETGRNWALNEQLCRLLHCLEHAYLRLRAGQYEQIQNDYYTALLGYRENRLFRESGQEFEGCVVGVTALGKLRIKKANGEQKEYGIKEVEWLWSGSHSSPEIP